MLVFNVALHEPYGLNIKKITADVHLAVLISGVIRAIRLSTMNVKLLCDVGYNLSADPENFIVLQLILDQ